MQVRCITAYIEKRLPQNETHMDTEGLIEVWARYWGSSKVYAKRTHDWGTPWYLKYVSDAHLYTTKFVMRHWFISIQHELPFIWD